MPAGYERLRDALKRKGKSDQEAKSMAAAIWNKHHKDDQVTNKKHDMEAKLDILHEFGLAKKVLPASYGGDQLMDSGGRVIKAKAKAASSTLGISNVGLWPSGKPVFMFEEQKFGVVLLGIPESDFYKKAEQLLADKFGRRLAAKGAAMSPQVKTALPVPVPKFPSSPNPNPNAAPVRKFGEWVDTTEIPKPGPELESVLAYLKKRNKKQVPLPRSQGGTGWFKERGDILDY